MSLAGSHTARTIPRGTGYGLQCPDASGLALSFCRGWFKGRDIHLVLGGEIPLQVQGND